MVVGKDGSDERVSRLHRVKVYRVPTVHLVATLKFRTKDCTSVTASAAEKRFLQQVCGLEKPCIITDVFTKCPGLALIHMKWSEAKLKNWWCWFLVIVLHKFRI